MFQSQSTAAQVGAGRFWLEVESVRGRWDVLSHPLYTRWSAGELSRDTLKLFANEYHHGVVATADLARRVADRMDGSLRDALQDRASDAQNDIGRWMAFARAAGWSTDDAWFFSEDPFQSTVDCARIWTCATSRSLAAQLVTLHAIDSLQPALANAQLTGLVEHSLVSDPFGVEYFHHQVDDAARNADLTKAALEPFLVFEDELSMLRQVEAVHRAHWRLLEGVLNAR